MKRETGIFRSTAWAVVLLLMGSLVLPEPLLAQEVDCIYDTAAPSVESARRAFNQAYLQCAKKELLDLLESPLAPVSEQANAHILLGTIYYIELQGEGDRLREAVFEQLLQAFRVFPACLGELPISAPDLTVWRDEARETAAEERRLEQERAEAARRDSLFALSEKKTGRKKLWLYVAGGVALAAVTVLALSGGGDDGGQTGWSIPDYPDPPQ